jgi:hypothetical protein
VQKRANRTTTEEPQGFFRFLLLNQAGNAICTTLLLAARFASDIVARP